jgi:hypothetical protein
MLGCHSIKAATCKQFRERPCRGDAGDPCEASRRGLFEDKPRVVRYGSLTVSAASFDLDQITASRLLSINFPPCGEERLVMCSKSIGLLSRVRSVF